MSQMLGKGWQSIEHKILDKQQLENKEYDKINLKYTKSIISKFSLMDKLLEKGLSHYSGFYCQSYYELFSDCLSWLDHINSVRHNRLIHKMTVVNNSQAKIAINQRINNQIQVQTQERPKLIERNKKIV
ncbi:unnamed protein product [Paramecium pentaurelia]|uniref:Uncharacterized protein n=1 Tax=Paramecium pentaurelia TaxID=43138 RepID=A0A8S1SUP0_9CILI|nr:unnamed protein product [Paramecium pentaurelia]